MPKDMQQIQYEQGGKQRAEAGAKKMNEASGLAAGSKINQGLGGLIKKLEGKTDAPAPDLSGEPQRSSFPPGLGGVAEYNKALSAWKAKNAKPVTSAKSLGGSR